MMRGFLLTRRNMLFSLVGLLLTATLTIWGCGGGSSYTDTTSGSLTTATPTALVSVATLKNWADEGKINNNKSADRVVILEVTSDATQYAQGHIPGAVVVNLADLTATRLEGPSYFGALVATGEQIDKVLQNAGIDENTTIVFTTSVKEMDATTLWNLTRGYTTFRYWGFPKNRLKVLDGGNKAWVAAGYGLESKTPSVSDKGYRIAPSGQNKVQADLRASLGEMKLAVQADQKDFIDGRNSITGGTTDLLDSAKYVVFDGRIKATNSRVLNYSTLVDASKKFKSITDTQTLLNIQSDTAYTLCRAGNIASVLFFAIDGYAYYDGSKKTVWYDGSWGQWGHMAGSDVLSNIRSTNAGGKLLPGSVWSTVALTTLSPDTPADESTVSTSRAYNVDFVTALGTSKTYRTVYDYSSYYNALLDSATDALLLSTTNQVESADKAYVSGTVTPNSMGATPKAGGGC